MTDEHGIPFRLQRTQFMREQEKLQEIRTAEAAQRAEIKGKQKIETPAQFGAQQKAEQLEKEDIRFGLPGARRGTGESLEAFTSRKFINNMIETLGTGMGLGEVVERNIDRFFAGQRQRFDVLDPSIGGLRQERVLRGAEKEILLRVAKQFMGRNVLVNPVTGEEALLAYKRAIAGMAVIPPNISTFGKNLVDFLVTVGSIGLGGDQNPLLGAERAGRFFINRIPPEVRLMLTEAGENVALNALEGVMEQGRYDSMLGSVARSILSGFAQLYGALGNMSRRRTLSGVGWGHAASAIASIGLGYKAFQSYMTKNPVSASDNRNQPLIYGIEALKANILRATPPPSNAPEKLERLMNALGKQPDNALIAKEANTLLHSIMKNQLGEVIKPSLPDYPFTQEAVKDRCLRPLGTRYQEQRFNTQNGVLGGNLNEVSQWSNNPSVRF
jgi:hypothetical protein